jgi:valyl-tRNA synthetase
VRNEYKVKPGKVIEVTLVPAAPDAAAAPLLLETIGALTKATVSLHPVADVPAAHQVLAGGTEVVIALAQLRDELSVDDTAKEVARLRTEIDATQKILDGVRAKLGNESFTSRAKPEVVEGARAQERDLAQKVEALTRKVEAL